MISCRCALSDFAAHTSQVSGWGRKASLRLVMHGLVGIAAVALCVPTTLAEKEGLASRQDLHGREQGGGTTTNLPHVLIIGDSISIGYTQPVTARLKDVANVQRVKGNCGDTRRGLEQLQQWLGDTRWDVIHFNWGLHDLCYRNPDSSVQGNRDKVNGSIAVPPEKYEANLDVLVEQLRQTGATLIWATTTPVPDGEAGRMVGDDLRYNAIAENVMKRHGVAINDLHALAAGFDPALFVAPGNVHFTKAGSDRLAEQVAERVKAALRAPRGEPGG